MPLNLASTGIEDSVCFTDGKYTMWLRNFMYVMGSYSTHGAYRVPCSCQGHGWSLSELGINSPTHCLPQLTFVVGLKGELSVLFLLNICCFRIFLHVKSANLPWVSSPLFPPSFRICKNHLLSIHWHPDFGWLRLNHVKSPFWLAESQIFSGWTSPLSPWNPLIKNRERLAFLKGPAAHGWRAEVPELEGHGFVIKDLQLKGFLAAESSLPVSSEIFRWGLGLFSLMLL